MSEGYKKVAVRNTLVQREPGTLWAEFEMREDESILSVEQTSRDDVWRVWITREVQS